MTQSIIPRPIAWVLSDNGVDENTDSDSQAYNLAPFSFFTGVCSDPPLLMLSIGKKPSGDEAGQPKDTRKNIERRKQFVVHIAGTDHLNALNQSAATLAHGVSEVSQCALTTVPFEGFSLPRLEGCAIALGCSLYRIDKIGAAEQAVIYGKIEVMYVEDTALQAHESRLVIDPKALDPLSRLGGNHYCALGETLSAKRPQ